MATERDPDRTMETLRAWRSAGREQPIIAVYNPATAKIGASWIFYQDNRGGDLEVSEDAIGPLRQQGRLDLRRDGPEDTWRAYPR